MNTCAYGLFPYFLVIGEVPSFLGLPGPRFNGGWRDRCSDWEGGCIPNAAELCKNKEDH